MVTLGSWRVEIRSNVIKSALGVVKIYTTIFLDVITKILTYHMTIFKQFLFLTEIRGFSENPREELGGFSYGFLFCRPLRTFWCITCLFWTRLTFFDMEGGINNLHGLQSSSSLDTLTLMVDNQNGDG